MDAKSLRLDVNTHVLLDVPQQVEDMLDAWGVVDDRLLDANYFIPPGVFEELARFADSGPTERDSLSRNDSVQPRMHTDKPKESSKQGFLQNRFWSPSGECHRPAVLAHCHSRPGSLCEMINLIRVNSCLFVVSPWFSTAWVRLRTPSHTSFGGE